MSSSKDIYDLPPNELYLNNTAAIKFDFNELHSMGNFNKDQSKEFYLGMIAAFRVSMSVVSSWIKDHPEDIFNYLTDCNLSASIIATQKH